MPELVTRPEWAELVGKKYPELLKKATLQGSSRSPSRSGVSILSTSMSASLRGSKESVFIETVVVDNLTKFRYITEEKSLENIEKALDEEELYSTRAEIIKAGNSVMTKFDSFRYKEFQEIQKNFKTLLKLDFEIDHANALMNPTEPGDHHPDNLQLLNSRFNSIKGKYNWKRFTIEEQVKHIRDYAAPYLEHKINLNIEYGEDCLEILIKRLEAIYQPGEKIC